MQRWVAKDAAQPKQISVYTLCVVISSRSLVAWMMFPLEEHGEPREWIQNKELETLM